MSTLSMLSSLIDRSLVVAEDHGESTRYRLLEPIRSFASAELADTGDQDASTDRHAMYFLRLAEAARPHLSSEGQAEWLERLDLEQPNIRLAFDLLMDKDDAEAAVGMTRALHPFFFTRGYFDEGRRWVEAALKASTDRTMTAHLLHDGGALAEQQGDVDAARAMHEESLRLFELAGDTHGMAGAYIALGINARARGDLEQAIEHQQEALAIYETEGSAAKAANALHNIGVIQFFRGDYPAAKVAYRRSQQHFRALGDQLRLAQSLNNLATIATMEEDYEAALNLHTEALEIRRSIGHRLGVAGSLSGLGIAALNRGDPAEAAGYYREAIDVSTEVGEPRTIARNRHNLAIALLALGDLDEAAHEHRRSLQMFDELNDITGLAESLRGIGQLLIARGDPGPGATLMACAERMRTEIGLDVGPIEDAVIEGRRSHALASLGADAFEAAWAAGRGMDAARAVCFALEAL